MPKDRKKAIARSRRYRERKKIEKYGRESAGVDMRGKHGNHAKGDENARWNSERLRTAHGYVLVRVSPDHPRAFGPPRLRRFKYAYEHDIVMETAIGRTLKKDEVVHHLNGIRDDNRPENLALESRSYHAREHTSVRCARGKDGRFTTSKRHRAGADPSEWPEALRIQEFPQPIARAAEGEKT